MQRLSPFVILKHLEENIEVEYASPKLIAQILKASGDLLCKQYDALYERLRIKENFFIKLNEKSERYTSSGIDEAEVMVDAI